MASDFTYSGSNYTITEDAGGNYTVSPANSESETFESFEELVESHPTCGCIVVGGGVPRNWAQQVFPYLDVVHRVKLMDCKFPGFAYGIRLSTDRPEFGGLSGCTFEESKSWGKYREDARFESVVCDATISLPLVATALLERLKASR